MRRLNKAPETTWWRNNAIHKTETCVCVTAKSGNASSAVHCLHGAFVPEHPCGAPLWRCPATKRDQRNVELPQPPTTGGLRAPVAKSSCSELKPLRCELCALHPWPVVRRGSDAARSHCSHRAATWGAGEPGVDGSASPLYSGTFCLLSLCSGVQEHHQWNEIWSDFQSLNRLKGSSWLRSSFVVVWATAV